jgi:hypothetical protein
MKGIARLLGAGTLGAMVLAGLPAQAQSANKATICTDVLAPGTYQKVVVPEDAVCLSDGPVTIRAGLFVESGATFVLGSEDNPVDTGTISGGVHATDPMNLQIHYTTINGGITSHGGSGPFGGPFDVTWTTIEDSMINGSVTIDGYDGFWMGFIRNGVHGSVNLNDNVVEDLDGNEYVTNTIHGSLNCTGDSPAPQIGDSGGEPNVVTGRKTGQCVEV